MAAVGLTLSECQQMCPVDILPACHNAIDAVTVSGPKDSIDKFIQDLKSKKIFAKEVFCSQIAFHSPDMLKIAPLLKQYLNKIICNPPKLRSRKWISSSVPEDQWNTPLALTSSPDYHVNNVCSAVRFQEALQHVPSDAITLELAPHCLLLAILKRSLPIDCIHLSLMKRDAHDHLAHFYTNLGNENNLIRVSTNTSSVHRLPIHSFLD